MKTAWHRRIPRAFTALVCLGFLAGVLIWTKLRIATDIPRSALAEPEEVRVDPVTEDTDDEQESGDADDADAASKVDIQD